MPSPKHRFYCFTLNNYSELPLLNAEEVRYATYQEEVGESGTPHLQGYIELSKQYTLVGLKKLLPSLSGAHFEQRRGTAEEARTYCHKEETRKPGTTPYEYGTFNSTKPGKRSDLIALRDAIKRGDSDKQLFEDFPNHFIRSPSGIAKAQKLFDTNERPPPQVYFLYGPPGTGKSFWASTQSPNAYWKQPDSTWWDGYSGNEDIVLDDFYGWLPFSTLLRLLDKYPLYVQTKGGNVRARPQHIYITSNRLPITWYSKLFGGGLASVDALYRRIQTWIYAGLPYDPEQPIPAEEQFQEMSRDVFFDLVE